MINLYSSVEELTTVGKTTSNKLKKLGINSVEDLLWHIPYRYEDYRKVFNISNIKKDEAVTIKGKIDDIISKKTRYGKKSVVEATISDNSGQTKVIWFNQPWILNNITTGDELFISGKVTGDLFDLYFNSPVFEKANHNHIHTAGLIPIYSSTAGISQKQLRFLINFSLDNIKKIDDYLPQDIIKKEKLISLDTAIRYIHFPKNATQIKIAKNRLSFDELFIHQMRAAIVKRELKKNKALAIKFKKNKTRALLKRLKFELTLDQKKSAWEILKDMQTPYPMNRLLEGDVGSGKTLVAAIAIYNVALNDAQIAYMAPTEILAHQHYQSLSKLFNNDINIGLLTSSCRKINGDKTSKTDFIKQCSQRKIDLIIGTHAIIQKNIKFKKLALIIIDEQHRFGVNQREKLKQENKNGSLPHFLSLTATPIPRSMALAIYGDLDISLIKEMPKGRKKIITRLVNESKRQLAYQWISKQIINKRQVFVICPLINESDKLGVKSVTKEYKKLNEKIFPDIKIEMLHGKMKSTEKEAVISSFKKNKTKILISTSVVEVGIDMPNASVMMIEDADRFGLAQLHQFRGRVGRSNNQSYCFLFSKNKDANTKKRLMKLVQINDGFELAKEDLKQRGAGQIFGYKQSGSFDLRFSDLSDDKTIKVAQNEAQFFLDQYNLSDFPELKEKLNKIKITKHLE